MTDAAAGCGSGFAWRGSHLDGCGR
ncbi:MAG: hypothetical protein DWI00_16785 [Planctomycetota bacterium]|nr:MAG: hypothetical protein DWI00_16785 [Planctomycetota bacterium]